jgi:hypothetical protein
MTREIDRVYRLTARRAPETISVDGFDASFFEEFETITEIVDHRIEFKIEKHLRAQPNTCDITITNLADATRDEFVRGKVRVRFEAGYDNTLRLLFVGDVRHASHEKVGTEWLTKLQIGDGARAYAEARAPRKSYAKGTPLATVLRDLARSFGVALPAEVAASDALRAQIAAGEVLSGYSSDELTRLLAPHGYEWNFQNGQLQILRDDQVRAGVIRVLSQDDGMIGAPVIDPPKITATKAGSRAKPKVPKVTVQHLLYPELTPGEKAKIESRSLNLTARIETVTHEGDTRGNEWTTTVEGSEV